MAEWVTDLFRNLFKIKISIFMTLDLGRKLAVAKSRACTIKRS